MLSPKDDCDPKRPPPQQAEGAPPLARPGTRAIRDKWTSLQTAWPSGSRSGFFARSTAGSQIACPEIKLVGGAGNGSPRMCFLLVGRRLTRRRPGLGQSERFFQRAPIGQTHKTTFCLERPALGLSSNMASSGDLVH